MEEENSAGAMLGQGALFIGVLLGVIAIVGCLISVAWFLSHGGEIGPEIGLPVLAISGVVLLLGTLSIVSIAFVLFGIEDKTQALGLPEGSIRAVIALSLIVLFGIFSVYLYSTLSQPTVENLPGLSVAERDAFVKGLDSGQLVKDVILVPGKPAQPAIPAVPGAPATGTTPATPGTPAKDAVPAVEEQHTVYFRNTVSTAGNDFAKQLLTLLGTLVTAVVSFYFGSKSGSSAPPSDSGPMPQLATITPVTGKAGETLPGVALAGTNLATVDQVRLVLNGAKIVGTNVLSNATKVTFDLTIPADAATGSWDVIASAKGVEYKLTGAFKI